MSNKLHEATSRESRKFNEALDTHLAAREDFKRALLAEFAPVLKPAVKATNRLTRKILRDGR